MTLVPRILVGLIGLLSLLSTAQHWFGIESLPSESGLQAIGDIGRANLRADVGGFFLGIGLFAIIAAWQQSRVCMAGRLDLARRWSIVGPLCERSQSTAIRHGSARRCWSKPS